MPKIPVINPKKLLKILFKLNFYIHHQTGSHLNLKHYDNNNLHVVIPMHNKDLLVGTLKSVLNQANLTVQDLINNL